MKTSIAITLLVTFSVLVLCGIGAFAAHTHHDMGACPFAAKLEVLCPPKTAEHLSQLAFFILSALVALIASSITSNSSDIENPSFGVTLHRARQRPPWSASPLKLALS